MFSSETITTTHENVATDSFQGSLFQHAQHDIDIIELENTNEKGKTFSKEHQIEFYDFDEIGNAESSETEITTDGKQNFYK